MTNSYSMADYQRQAYPQQTYSGEVKTAGLSTIGIMTAGAIAGGTVGYFKNRYPVSKDGSASDVFAREVFEKNLKKNGTEESKNFFKQLKDVLKKIDKVKSPEDFKKLADANREIISGQCRGISVETMLDTVNITNLKASKDSLKKTLAGIMDFELTKTKNAITMGWNKESKKFVKTPEFKDDKLFTIIKNTKNNGQWKKALKYGGISAGVLGALTIGYKALS